MKPLAPSVADYRDTSPEDGGGRFGLRDFASDSPSGDQVLSLCITSPNSSQVSPLKRDSCTAWTG